MAPSPVVFAVVAMISWGLWTAIAKIATETVDPTVAMILSYVTSIAIAIGYLWIASDNVSITVEGVGWALVSGIFAGIGAIAFYSGIAQGRAGTVTTISALYFVVAVGIGIVLFGNPLGIREVVGFVFAILSVVLLAG
ncbi:EamA family transporter [Natrinema halophilum]|uniref:DMT family transporter n=1 Tax=Natrinema halophilum TaxID=1699371 RepID=A0A7D5KT73_9EURY|nr:DMT family transporter [Natrinema halophilum]QLG50204.1 DMT family transporter [Natrinema halophilum]